MNKTNSIKKQILKYVELNPASKKLEIKEALQLNTGQEQVLFRDLVKKNLLKWDTNYCYYVTEWYKDLTS
jgi:hypothetical protein